MRLVEGREAFVLPFDLDWTVEVRLVEGREAFFFLLQYPTVVFVQAVIQGQPVTLDDDLKRPPPR